MSPSRFLLLSRLPSDCPPPPSLLWGSVLVFRTIPVLQTMCLCACLFCMWVYFAETDWRDSSAGAVAELFDISCLASTNSKLLSTIDNDVFNLWNSSRADSVTVQQLIATLPNVASKMILSQHYFITNAAGGISPVWDFRATPKFKGVANAVFVGKALANTPDANPTKNVPWLHLGKVSGDISDEIYRIYTVGGVAPPSVSSHCPPVILVFGPVRSCIDVTLPSQLRQCVSGTTKDISVKYTSQYWFYGGSLGLGSK